ncbi:hypothetical protein FA10DRAFT_259678 [Acaromyces ingoldii]|uniref:Secreted protein n=1 Tax=Acaromyces ingoldii TaxID=215250 RepID=A0A316YTG0_9BASI|nr:hypothetical protein FA10DRAFT_259678 [Acaromyces ingoldii]PWN92511.1 hypothetical protein FA10DRAFT_259678 [Acaromyces ingoldii]
MRAFRYLVPILVVLSWVTCFPPQDLPDILDLQDAQALQDTQDLQDAESADRTHKKKTKKKKKKVKVCRGPIQLDPDYINEYCTAGIVCVVLPSCAYAVEAPGDHHCRKLDRKGNGRQLCMYKTNYFQSEDVYAFFSCDIITLAPAT